jgi:ribosomal protein L11 methyltransferase
VTRSDSADPDEPPELRDSDEGTSADGAWMELSVRADSEAVEAVSEILSRYASGGASVEPAFELVDDGLAAREVVGAAATVRAYLPARDPAAVRTAVAGARAALGHLQAFRLRPIGELETRVVHESDWADAWKRHFPVLHVGRRLVIRPSWRRHRPAAREVVLALDPGMAFGTGLHPTTRLCLAALERLADDGTLAGQRVLDVGSGSGILSIAAAKLGAGRVLAVDPDMLAVEASVSNARRNRVGRIVAARRGSVPTGDGPFGVVVANLVASLLADLADALSAELRPGGTLLASGIFVDREPEVRDAFERAGLRIAGRTSEGDWVLVEAIRADGDKPERLIESASCRS